MLKFKCMVLMVAVCAGATMAMAQNPYDGYANLEYWGGDGSSAANRMTFILDFGGTHYGFGYGWETGSKTSWDMLTALESAGGLSYTYHTDWGSPYVTSLSYDGLTMVDNASWPAQPGETSTVLWESTDGLSWATTNWGISDNPIADGGWNAFTETAATNWPGSTPVPEPASLGLLALGGAALLKRRRRS